MLYLTRKVGESVVIDNNIEVTVIEVRGKTARLGLTFPSGVSVLRKEVYDRVQEENRAALESASALFPDEDDAEADKDRPADADEADNKA